MSRFPEYGREEFRQVRDVQVREPDLSHIGILEQIIGTGRTLKAGPKDEHSHFWESLGTSLMCLLQSFKSNQLQTWTLD